MMYKNTDMVCDDLARREKVLAHPTINGIDYIEVPKDDQQNIRVYFIKPNDFPTLRANQVQVAGGVRIRNIRVEGLLEKTDTNSKSYLQVHVDQSGDFSTYVLIIDAPGQVDIAFSRHPFSFKAGCPSDFDCHRELICPTEPKVEPVIDYLAKDYASFRQALIDLIPTLVPDWKERHEADLGIALVELLAYVGDQLSYYQDAVANEAYLETARQRESVRRHARLIDYSMHDGANARTFVHVQVSEGTSGNIPAGTAVLSRLNAPLGSGMMPPHGPEIPNSVSREAHKAADVVFETVKKVTVDARLNEIQIYTWGNKLCCLPRGATTLYLVGDLPLRKDDLLLLEEVKGVEKGLPANADRNHRQVVRLIEEPRKTEDPLQGDTEAGTPLKLTQVIWHRSDALTFPLCVSSQLEDGTVVSDVSVARGNLVLADHGRTIEEWHPAEPNVDPADPGAKKRNIAYRFELKNGPMTFHTPTRENDEHAPSVREMSQVDPRKTIAHCNIERYEDQSDPSTAKRPEWEVVSHLLDSSPFHRHFVVETRNNGRAIIRFGDGQHGMEPPDGSHLKVTYRVGNGFAGSVGAETLVHVLQPDPPPSNWPDILGVRNPLPTWGGIEPETIDQVKLLAPKAFHAEQFRAVTEADYARAAEKHPEVDRAVAAFRWTGSWHTVFVAIDPVGRTDLTQELEAGVRSHLSRYGLAGYDVEVDPPMYVSLGLEIDICVARDHFRAHVEEALLEALGKRELPDGRNGLFHPDNFTFGQTVYLSRIYSAVEEVDGVASAVVRRFIRLHDESDPEPNRPATKQNTDRGYIPMERLEIARLDNDPSFPENGVLHLNMMGGK